MARPSSLLVKVSAVRVMRPARARASRRTSNCLRSAMVSRLGARSVWRLPVAREGTWASAEDGAEVAGLRGRGFGKGLRGCGVGGGEVALATGTVGVGGVAEVADDGAHAALLRFREGDHAVELRTAKCDLGFVAGPP